LILELPRVCSTVASAGAAVDVLAEYAGDWTGQIDAKLLKAVKEPMRLADLLAEVSVPDPIALTVAVRVGALSIGPSTVWVDADDARRVAVGAARTALERASAVDRAKVRASLRKQTAKVI